MAIPMPQIVREAVTNSDLNIRYDNYDVLTSAFTGRSSVFARGFPLWSGTLQFGPYSVKRKPDVVAAVEAYLNAINGPVNSVDIPLERSMTQENFRASVVEQTRSPDTLRLNTEILPTEGSYSDLKVGHYIKVGFRLFQIIELPSNNVVGLNPQRLLRAADVLEPAEFVEARLLDTATVMPHNAGLAGPYVLNWIENG